MTTPDPALADLVARLAAVERAVVTLEALDRAVADLDMRCERLEHALVTVLARLDRSGMR